MIPTNQSKVNALRAFRASKGCETTASAAAVLSSCKNIYREMQALQGSKKLHAAHASIASTFADPANSTALQQLRHKIAASKLIAAAMLGASGCDEVPCTRGTQATVSTADRGTQSAPKQFASAGCQTEDDFPGSPLDPFQPDASVSQHEAGSVVDVDGCSSHLQRSTDNSETGEQRSPPTTSRDVHKKAGTKPHTCTVCQRVFPQKTSLTSHMRVHTAERRFICKVCGQAFMYERSLLLHEQAHTNGKFFICSTCRSVFASQGGLTNHERSHNRPVVTREPEDHGDIRRETSEHSCGKPFVCGSCQRRFTTKACLKIHERLHTEPFTPRVRSKSSDGINMASICPVCARHFPQYRGLVTHMWRTHAERFNCRFCAECYTDIDALLRHEKVHDGETRLVCRTCEKVFASRECLVVHEQLHTEAFIMEPCTSGSDTHFKHPALARESTRQRNSPQPSHQFVDEDEPTCEQKVVRC